MLGHAGSGKSYFARQLATEKKWVRLNGDSMRMALFGSREEAMKHPDSLTRTGVFKAIDYVAEHILQAGHSVIFDSNNNRKDIRLQHAELARKYGALPVVVWVQAPKELAVERTQQRDEAVDQFKMDPDLAKSVVERHMRNFDEPTGDELVVTIDGTEPFEKQLKTYNSQLENMHV